MSRRVGGLRLLVLACVLLSGIAGGGEMTGAAQRANTASTTGEVPPTAADCPPPLFGQQPGTTRPECRGDRPGAGAAASGGLPPGFSESIVFDNLTLPTAVRFARDGRVFIAEKEGVVKVFASLEAATPTVVVDLRERVMSYSDRGLLGIELDPNFPATPDLYLLYTLNARPGGAVPAWPDDSCPDDAAATTPGCVVMGRLSRFTLNAQGQTDAARETVLIEDWCQQFTSHSIGDLAFGADGALYVSAGDGASYNGVDIGQYGTPANPCGDPPREGGALRSQDARTGGDPLSYDGTILRVDPRNPSDRRIVADGLRNPFRFAVRPRTRELWVGNVGWYDWEEINRVTDPTDGIAENFGWPCYEANDRQSGYAGAGVPICERLYATPGAVNPPAYAYRHGQETVPGDGCQTRNGSSVTGVAFYTGDRYPAAYRDALFFGDYARGCIWTIAKGANGEPDPATIALFHGAASVPIDLRAGPGGDLFYVDISGSLRRIRYLAPQAIIRADTTSGVAPLTVHFDGRNSTDPNGRALGYAWDLDGDGAFDDATSAQAQGTYGAGRHTVGLRITNDAGLADTATIAIDVGTPPSATIVSPLASATWAVGTTFAFEGAATGSGGAALPDSAFSWALILAHCPPSGGCHAHPLQQFTGVRRGTFTAPDHEYPARLELRLTVRDAAGLTDTEAVTLLPQVVTLAVTSDPPGLSLAINADERQTPFTATVIRGSSNTVGLPSQLPADARFVGWSVDGAAAGATVPLTVTASGDRAIRANFTAPSPSAAPSPGPVPSPPTPPVPRFTDVPPEYWAAGQIGQIAARGITTGCAAGEFCPERPVTRAEMAAFLIRTLTGTTAAPAGPATPTFSDVPPTHPQYGYIEALAARGVTTGCGGGEYCPDREVTRAEMAAFIIRALTGSTTAPPGPSTATFADVPLGHPQYGFIERMFSRKITTGCGDPNATPRNYCPGSNVTRAEMAVFIIRAYP